MKLIRVLHPVLSLTAALACVPMLAPAAPFTPGNLAVLSPDNATATDTSFSIVEITTGLNQANAVQTISINSTTMPTELRMSTSGTSGGFSASADGTLLCFPGYNTNTTLDTSTLIRGVGTLNSAGVYAMPAAYTGASGNQTRSAATLDNQHFFWADKGGIYTNGATTPPDSQNVLRMKSFGSSVYVLNAQGLASVVSTWTVGASSLTALPGIPTATDGNAKDFYLIASGNNGATYDTLYQIDSTANTAGTILKYALVSGSWVAKGTYTTSIGGNSLCAAKSGSGAVLYVVTGSGAVADNKVEMLTDSAAYNATISVTDNGTLYTATGVAGLRSVAFAPVSYTVTYSGNNNTSGSAPVDINSPYAAGATVTAAANTGNLARTGYTFSGWNTSASGSETTYAAGSGTFAINANTTLYALWTPAATYTVTYNGNGNTGGAAPTDPNSPYASGATVTVLGNTGSLTDTGYSFAGWNTAANGSGTSYSQGNTFTTSQNTTLYAQWTQNPSITISTALLNFPPVPVNGSSASMTYTVSGANLTANLSINSPTGFQISLSSGSGFGSSLSLTPSGGTVNSTTIYVQFDPSAQQSYSGNIANTSSGAAEQDVALTGAGANAPSVSTQAASSITSSGATLNGTVTSANNSPITDRGFYYQTTPGVTTASTKADQGGTTVSAYSKALSGLSANQIYYYRAYAVNGIGTTLDTSDTSFYTLANTPAAPLVGPPTTTTLRVAIGSGDGNLAATPYAIQEANSGLYVQANGTLGASAVFQTASTWGITTVANLQAGTFYSFQVQAQNAAGMNTVFGPAATASTLASPYQAAGSGFRPGNLAVLSPDNGTASATTFHVLEISPSVPNTVVQSVAINGTTGNPGTAMTMGTSATSGGLSLSADGTLLTFPGYITTNISSTTGGANFNERGVGTLNSAGLFTMPAYYQGNGSAGNQTRSVTTLDNQHFIWADKGGVYTNWVISPSDGLNVLRVKSFGGTVYVISQKNAPSVISTLSADASTLYPLPNYPTAADSVANDFYLISSGNNGSLYDIIYQVDAATATSGTIYKYSLVSGEWGANGSYTTTFGGCGICAAASGSGAALYVVTTLGNTANNKLEKLTDSAGYNAPITIVDDGALYTAPGATSLKGVTFTPVSYSVTYNGNNNTGGAAPTDSQTYGAGATVTELGNSGNLTRAGYVFAGWNTVPDGSGADSSGGMNFNITSNTTFYADWATVGSPETNTVEVGSTVNYSASPTGVAYQWYSNSAPIVGQTGATLTLTDVQLGSSGSYSVVVNAGSSIVSNLIGVLTVVDTHPPVLTLPPNMIVFTGTGGVAVTYNPAPTAYSAAVGNVPVICTPPSGSLFSPGTTLVNCTASDGLGNVSSGSFTVTVITTNATTNIVVDGVIYIPYSTNLAPGTWVWLDADPAAGSLLRATQRLVGFDEVTEKSIMFAGFAFSQVIPTTNGAAVNYDYSAQSSKNSYTVGQLVNKYDPIVISPDGLAYITDDHHTMAAYLASTSPIHQIIPGYNRVALGQITENMAVQPPINDSWWLALQAANNAYLYGTSGDQLVFAGEPNYANSQPILPSAVPMPTTPSELSVDGNIAMIDDDGRSLGWGVRQGIVPSAYNNGGSFGGYANTAPNGAAINFVDFFWEDFFRNRVVWNNSLTPIGNGDANAINAPLSFYTAVANGIALAKSELYRDQNGRSLFDYANLLTFADYYTNANTVAWASTAIGNGLAAVGDTYNLYLRDDSTISGDIIPSALSTNLLHIDTTAGMTVTQLVKNVKYLYVNMGAQMTTIFPDAFVPNSTLTFPAGTGEVWLNNTSYVSAASVISNGICSVNGVLNSAVVTVANGSALAGTGTINGAVTVQNSATLSPGNSSIGTLTVNGPVTLAGTTVMEINKSGGTLTSDLVTGVTTLTFGGTLTVGATGDALVGGETFTLFSAGQYAGAFTTLNLPSLAAGLHWDVSKLVQNGTIQVLGVGPVAETAYYTRTPDLSLIIHISDLLTNVTDANGFTISFVGAGTDGLNDLTTNGATLFNEGAFIGYTNSVTPNVNDGFKYTVSDGHGSTATGNVLITINNSGLVGQQNANLIVGTASVTANFFGVSGYRYAVDRSTNLTAGAGLGWVPISTNTAPAGGLIQILDNFQDLGIPIPPLPSQVFYRLRYNP